MLRLENWCFLTQNANIWGFGLTLSKTNVRFEISTFEIKCRQNFVERLESWYFFAKNTQVWAFGLEVWKTKAIRKFYISQILKFWAAMGRFTFFFDVVLAGFSWFRLAFAGFCSFWLVLACYGILFGLCKSWTSYLGQYLDFSKGATKTKQLKVGS